MADAIPTLVCTCGNIMKAPGAKPGRVGKCPKCGALLTVQGEPTATLPEPRPAGSRPDPSSSPSKRPVAAESAPARRSTPVLPSAGGYGIASSEIPESAFQRSNEQARPVAIDARPVQSPDVGPLKAPLKMERSLAESLRYPLWSWSSVGLLAFVPLFLVFTTSPISFVLNALFSGSPFAVPGFVSMIPISFFLLMVMGFVLIYLGDILVATASGEIIPPRRPGIDADLTRAVGRWFWAILSGVVVGGLPAAVYWMNCGEIDWTDRFYFLCLLLLGVAYAQLALLAALLHDDPLAANPVTVFKAMSRLGLGYVGVCCFTATVVGVLLFVLTMLSQVKGTIPHLILSWLYWVVAFYAGMVLFRRLGLYCYQQKIIRSWFADRPRWGVRR